MPGLVGFTIADNNVVKPDAVLGKMLELITHHNFYVQDPIYQDKFICASRSHTNVIQTKKQPFAKNGILVWLDGEFYNQNELQVVAGLSDPEILASPYSQNEDFSFLARIDGIYSAVLLDKKKKRVHLFGDRYGLRHLYFTKIKDSLVWFSETKALLAHPNFSVKIDLESLDTFLKWGHLLGNRSWFEGANLLPLGTVLTFDLTDGAIKMTEYWNWENIQYISGPIDENEVIKELGRLFKRAVKKRVRPGESIGLQLSGGLDSRAILAALPDTDHAPTALTFGQSGCEDIEIAAVVAKLKNVDHQVVTIDGNNWIDRRFGAVWYLDGGLTIHNLHIMSILPKMREHFDINLSGYLGDALIGGTYLNNKLIEERELYADRGRRFIKLGDRLTEIFIQARIPFFDNDLLEFALSLPPDIRRHSYIFNKMLLNEFPTYFSSIPWQKTGLPVTIDKDKLLAKKEKRGIVEFHDVPLWLLLGRGPQAVKQLLLNPKALYRDYLSLEEEFSQTFRQYLSGIRYDEQICRYMTLEIWLQQVFNNKYRPLPID